MGNGLRRLDELVRTFDFRAVACHHSYVDMDPRELLAIADGFLGESDSEIGGGGRRTLLENREMLTVRIIPAYEAGLQAGSAAWRDSARVYGSLGTEGLHALALRSSPDEPSIQSWFAEGFCFAYSRAELVEVVREATPGGEPQS